ncbi:peptide chain release factor N(5)-glutamine methyltransferase [Sulfurospirillum cavolei]|uniref:peptide chain release factor N(5)-glutamine methyltransferase n=1 Tax=Sulfurospirillum cavolei TaxID=366522 RepID=UPI003FA23900
MRIKEIIAHHARLLKNVSDVPQKEVMVLLAELLHQETSWLVAHGDEEIVLPLLFEEWINRRMQHEPLEYILGRAEFYAKTFYVDSNVLIPRPETELLVDKVVEEARALNAPVIVEIGTGSGIIAIMTAHLLPNASIIAVDISGEALNVAKKNARLHGVEDRIEFIEGSYLAGIQKPIDILVSNPPYIALGEPLAQGLSYEPSLALFGGEKGDEMLCRIIDLYVFHNIKTLICEMGYDQRIALTCYAEQKGLEIEFYKDLAGLDRGFWIKEQK